MNATLHRSELWAAVEQLKLTENTCPQRRGITEQEAEEIRRFADWLLEVGTRICSDNNDHVKIPAYIQLISPDDGLPDLTAATHGEVWRNELLEADDEILAWLQPPKRSGHGEPGGWDLVTTALALLRRGEYEMTWRIYHDGAE
jgi:hypothetical protein